MHAQSALPPAAPAAPASAASLEPVVISGSGVERRAFETPYAVDVVDAEALRNGGPMVNLSEALGRVPGLSVNLRNNYAQDLQISSRGFGARTQFGVRGIRLYTDGIPASMPDGSGTVTHFDLAGAQRIEVLRGPFSALYGNSSGGVISLVSSSPTRRVAEVDADLGSNNLHQLRFGVEAPLGNGWDVRAQASQFETDGPRDHSAARRTLGNLRVGWRGELDTVTVLVNSLDQPAQDPLGLTREQFRNDPHQVATQATAFDTRKNSTQNQAGVQWRHTFSALGALHEGVLTAYAGKRSVTQWQAIPAGAQTNPSSPGGVIDFDRDYEGIDGRLIWRWQRDDAHGAQLIVGMASDQLREARRGYENFIGTGPDQQLGVTGALRRDETNHARTLDSYAQGEIEFGPGLAFTLGARAGELKIDSDDHYLSNGNDSAGLAFNYLNPVAALQWKARSNLNLYISTGRGFESPTLTELAYRPAGLPGLNTDLRAQHSDQLEVGAKWRDPALGLDTSAAVFDARTANEIGVQSNTGGRAVYQNVGRTQRRGVELATGWQASETVHAQLALTWLDATYSDNFLSCQAAGCTTATAKLVSAGNRIAGTAKENAWLEVAWQPLEATEFAVELRGQGPVAVNDRNSDFAGGFATCALRAGHTYTIGPGKLALLVRVDNVTDRSYAGSVIVNEGNDRYFEPAAGRTLLASARWSMGF